MNSNYTEVLIVGTVYHLTCKKPNKNYQILEMRNELGGTYSLFKHLGIRSDIGMINI